MRLLLTLLWFVDVATLPLVDTAGKPVTLQSSRVQDPAGALVLPQTLRTDCAGLCTGSALPVLFDTSGKLSTGVIVDATGTVRREFKDTSLKAAIDTARSWKRGRETYEAQCARCHGVDGRDTNYVGIKPLNGIGKKYSIEQIVEATQRTGSVDLSALKAEQKRELAIYVAGL